MTLEILSGQAPKVASPEPPHTRLANARRVPSLVELGSLAPNECMN